VRLLTARPEFYAGARVVGLLSFSAVAWGAYTVVAIGIGRARFTQFNWVVSGGGGRHQRRALLSRSFPRTE
jgi:hypothetical protein